MARNPLSTITLTVALAVACTDATPGEAQPRQPALQTPPALTALGAHAVVPAPTSVVPGIGAHFTLTATTTIDVPPGGADVARLGEMLAAMLRPPTGFPVPVSTAGGGVPRGAIALRLGGSANLGDEAYELTITADSVRLVAARPAGLFRGLQTLRQLKAR
jgi:hexosaminidase